MNHLTEFPVPQAPTALQRRLWSVLLSSALAARSQAAFEAATGLPLWFEATDGSGETHRPCGAEFCQAVCGCPSLAAKCSQSHAQLRHLAQNRDVTLTCFAGMSETAIPLRACGETIGYLRTGQVKVGDHPVDLDQLPQEFRNLLNQTPEHAPNAHAGAIDLLRLLASSLSAELERHASEPTDQTPEPVRKACEFVRLHYAEDIVLEDLARHCGVSSYHLCHLFKSATGMTLTEYQNRHRVEQAQKMLQSRYSRVTEVALDVGFGSLSQWNRCFQKYTGQSPSQYKASVLSRAS